MTNTKQAQRTPGPWQYVIGQSGTRGLICTTTGETVVNIHAPAQIEANAAFIVRACNAHDDLLAALKYIATRKYNDRGYDENMRPFICDLQETARDAIAKAEA